MRAGELNRKVNILQNIPVQDGYGSPVENWTIEFSTWAKIKPLRGRQYFVAQQANSEVTTEITLRYNDSITDNKRIQCGDVVFEILYVAHEDFAKKFLICMCKEATTIGH